MARTTGRHRISRRTKIATGLLGLSMAAGGLVIATTTGDTGQAGAHQVARAFYVDITRVEPNVNEPAPGRQASTGTFTVNCGTNENGHFNADNFIAQPGVENGAQHVHDYVGNVTTNANSNNQSLAAGDTTCANGDQSTYYWPVIRINQGRGQNQNGAGGRNQGSGGTQRNQDSQGSGARSAGAAGRISCPDVASQLPDVPGQAQAEVQDNLEQLENQLDEANQRLASSQGEGGPDFAQNAIVGPLADKRTAAINRIATAIGRAGERPQLDVENLASCALTGGVSQAINDSGFQNGGEQNYNGNSDRNNGRDNDARNNFGGGNGGNQNNNGSRNDGGQNNDQNGGSQNNGQGDDQEFPAPSGPNQEVGINRGPIVEPEQAIITFRGNAAGPVVPMPRFLRVLTGEAKPNTNGPGNVRPSWTCTGFADRLLDRYPICPEGSKVVRIHDFPSCWDGRNIDSDNHRTHIVFPEANGQCRRGFRAVPQLRITLIYDIPREVQLAGQYTVDSFPEEQHNPASDHDDFANAMSEDIMRRVVNCINSGQTCAE